MHLESFKNILLGERYLIEPRVVDAMSQKDETFSLAPLLSNGTTWTSMS